MPSIRLLDSGLATYNYSTVLFNPVAAATDVWQLSGVLGKTVKVRWIEVGGTCITTARQQTVSLIRRSTATAGGTNTTPTPQKADPADGAASAVITQWTTLPGGLGTTIGTVDSTTFSLMLGTSIQDRAIFNYEQATSKPIVMNQAVQDFLCVNFTGVNTIATDKLDFEIWWTEN